VDTGGAALAAAMGAATAVTADADRKARRLVLLPAETRLFSMHQNQRRIQAAVKRSKI
jgi:hypothetical protein